MSVRLPGQFRWPLAHMCVPLDYPAIIGLVSVLQLPGQTHSIDKQASPINKNVFVVKSER